MEEQTIEAVRPHLFLYDTNHSDYMKSKLKQDIWSAIAKDLNLSSEVYDVTTVHKFGVPYPNNHDQGILNYVPPCELNEGGCSEWYMTGWIRTELGKISTSIPFSGDQYDASSGGIVPVPADEFVISVYSGSEIYIYLLAGDDVITSDMIYIQFSSQYLYAGICTKETVHYSSVGLPYKEGRIARNCYTTNNYYSYNVYTGSVFVKQSPSLEVWKKSGDNSGNLLNQYFYDFYNNNINNKFSIMFVAIGVSSGSASFKVWPSFRIFNLSEHSGVMSANTEANGSVVCLSLTYYLQPNSGASIKVLVVNDYNEVTVVGTATAPHGDIQVASMTTQQFILEVKKDEGTHLTYKIQAERSSSAETVLISGVRECQDTEFPNVRTVDAKGTTEIHAMTNARGLPILLSSNTTTSSYVGVNMEECIPLDGGCNWTVSSGDWASVSLSTGEFPPLRLSDSHHVWSLRNEEGSFTSPAFVPSSNTLCVSLTYYLPLSADNSLHLSIHWPGGDKQDFDSIEAVGEWKTVRLTAPLATTKLNEQMTVELKGRKSEKSNVFIQRIAGCNGKGFEDVLVLSDGDVVNIQNIGYDVAVVQSGNKNSMSSNVSCENNGVFDMEYGSCVCPAGFTGSTCEKGCGANRFGASCEAVCSKTKEHCRRMVLCRPKLGCNCASGLKGIMCNTYCDSGEYGAGCKQKCGRCANMTDCNRYTGECPHGCDPGYYPPFCQDTYKYLLVAPVVSATNVQGFKVTANLNDSRGKQTPTFFQLQYRENLGGNNSWQEVEPLPVLSHELSGNVTGLKPGINYEVRVVLLDRDGTSYQESNVPYANVTTLCTIPGSVHYDLQALEISEDSFQLSWKFVSKSHEWCAVTKFVVEYEDGVRWLKLYQGKETTTRVWNLLPGQEYQVRVRALGRDKAFPFSDIVSVITNFGAPEEVHELRVVSGMNHDLEVDWTPPLNIPGSVRRYRITYQCRKLLACRNEDCGYSSGEVEATAPPIVLHDLLPYAQYTISVAALAALWGPSKELLIVTDMREPDVAPELNAAMPVSDRTNSSFAVHWQPPHNCTFLNGYLYKYRFQLVGHNNSTPLREGITHLTSANFSGLMPLTMYTVRVYLVTSGGWNPKHPLEIPAQTKPTTPDHVEQLVVYKKGRRMLGLRWAAPKQTYGQLKSFVVSYQLPEQDQQIVLSVKPTPCPAWPHLYCHTINGLQPDTEYSVVVQAQNVETAGVGEPAKLTAVTKETAPLSPSYIHIMNQTQTNLTIEWGPPDLLNGVLRSFLVTIEEIESFNSSACCEYFPIQEVAVQSEKMNSRLEFSGLRPASSYAVSVSAKTVALGPAASITAHTRPPIPSMANAIEIPGNVTYLSDGSTTIHIHPLTEYQDLIRGYLLLVLPESNESNTPRTAFFDDWLTKEVDNHVNGIYYFAAEFDQDDLEENSEVLVGSGHDLKVGKWGEMQDPKLENKMGYRFGLVITLEYCGVHSVGYAVTDVLHVDY